MTTKFEYNKVNYEEYFGPVETIKKKEDFCTECSSKLIHTHLPDYRNLTIRETSRCFSCSGEPRRSISLLH